MAQIHNLAAALLVCVATAGIFGARAANGATSSPTAIEGQLNAVSATSATNAWAVGQKFASAFALHYNGVGWSPVTLPAAKDGVLESVTALSAGNVWAVGFFCSARCSSSQPTYHTLVLHWKPSKWSIVASPNRGNTTAGPGRDFLYGIAAVSSSNIWAVGNFESGTASYSLILHWNGSKWAALTAPGATRAGQLDAVSVVSASNIWATGSLAKGQLVMHRNATTWQVVKAPSPAASAFPTLSGLSSPAASDVWASGSYGYPSKGYVEHWNGSAWHLQQLPTSSYAAAALGPKAVFVASTNIIYRWNGTSWKTDKLPSPGNFPALFGIKMLSATNGWAVGDYTPSSSPYLRTLIYHWNGSSWTRQ